jgi:DNA-binding CsgD family transcriptional regulator
MRISRVGDVRKRFFERFEVVPSGCWIWMGTKIKMGRYFYGAIAGEIDGVRYSNKGVKIGAHRASWILHNGPIPEGNGHHGTVVMHKCDNPLCVNPDHLMLGTQQDNVQDMNAKSRGNTRGIIPKTGTEHKNAALTPFHLKYVIESPKTAMEIAKELGVSRHLIDNARMGKTYAGEFSARKLEKHRAERKKALRHGTTNPISKLTEDQVRYIRSSDKTTYVIAEEFGVSQPTIANARRKATYKNVK